MHENGLCKTFIQKTNLAYIVIVIMAVATLVVRLALLGILKNYFNKKLNELPGYTGHVANIDIHLLFGAYVIRGLMLKKKTDPAKYFFLKIRHIDLSLEWGALFKGRLVGEVIANQPSIHILATEDISKEPSRESWTKTVKALMPISVNKL